MWTVRRVIEVKELTLPEVKTLLEQRGKESELDRVQRVTLDYATKFSKVDPDVVAALKQELTEQHGLSQFAAIQLINILPESIDELRTLLTREGRTFSTEELENILATLNKYRRKEE